MVFQQNNHQLQNDILILQKEKWAITIEQSKIDLAKSREELERPKIELKKSDDLAKIEVDKAKKLAELEIGAKE